MGMKDRISSIRTTLRLDNHHAIERFGVLFGALCVTFLLVITTASGSSIASQRHDMDSTSLYVNTFSTSKTQVAGEVPGVFVNADRTRAMVLMHFKDSAQVSANAKKYQGFLTGATKELGPQALASQMHGRIVAFGSTGYLAMVIDSDRPFAQQILNLTMRANSELVYTPSESRKVREDLTGEKTFAQFDQWRIYFNPGASSAKVTSTLNSKDFDAGAVYAQLIVDPEEKTARDTLDDALAQMQVDRARITEYTAEARRQSVDGIRLVLPDEPTHIAGDVVTGKPSEDGRKSTLGLDAKWVDPSGYDFDWRNGSVEQGYLDQIVPKGESYVSFLTKKDAASADSSGSSADESFDVNDIQWKLSNGSLLSDYSTGTGDTTMAPLIEVRNELAQAYADYDNHKKTYQTDDYQALIDLEVALRNVRSGATENTSAKALFTY